MSQYPPQWQQQPFPQQPNTSYPPQQPFPPPQFNQHQYSPQYQQQSPTMSQQPPPKKKHGTLFWILLLVGILLGFGLLSIILIAVLQPASTPVLSEGAYKDSATFTSVSELDKDGNSDQGKSVHFTCKILNFVKDSNGNTAAANVEPSDTLFGSIIQVGFPSGTDLSQLNADDTIEVWGIDNGVSSGQNAFGTTVQEVTVSAQYMTDLTTNYQQ
jgi:hypothetical protein